MSNTVQNRLVVTGPNTQVIEQLLTTLEEHGMAYWRPRPQYLSDDWFPNDGDLPKWYRWSLDHWGTKWDLFSEGREIIECNDGYGIFHFETANSSIEPFVDFLKTLFPDYEFDLEYMDIDYGEEEMEYYSTRSNS